MPKSFHAILLLLTIQLFLSFGLFAQAHAADEIIIQSQNKYKEITSFQADFTQVLTHQESNTSEERQGTIKFSKPFLLNFHTISPSEELLVVTTNEIWDYLPQEELAYKYSLELALDSKSLISVLTGQSPLDQDFEIEKLADEDGFAKYLLYPYEATTQMVEAILWLNPKTFLIEKVRIMDFFGNLNQVALLNIQPNASVSDLDFSFTPPKEIDIEDLTDPENPIVRPLMN